MTGAFAVSIAVIMLFACGGLIWYSRSSAEQSADSLLRSAADKTRLELSESHEGEESRDSFREQSEALTSLGLVMLVTDKSGHVLWQSQKNVPTAPFTNGDDWRVATVRSGDHTYVIGMPWERTDDALERQSLTLITLSLFVVLIASVGAWALVGRTLLPIASLSREANTASTDSLRIRLSEPSRDAEIVELVATLNGLLARLSETAAAKGRFYSAASHELRTPLQALSGHLELAHSRSRTAEEYSAAVDEAYKQTRRLISLAEDLLLLNQLDVDTNRSPKETVNLAEICETVMSQMAPIISKRNLQVEERLSADVEANAVPTYANMLVRNLVENAVKYASEGGRVTIDLSPMPAGARLEVFNECPRIPVENLDQLFEAFYRPDQSRQSGTGGNGLGLAICKAIAIANGWRISLHQDDSGVTAVVEFRVS